MPVNGVSKVRPILFTFRVSLAEQAQLKAVADAHAGGDRTRAIRELVAVAYDKLDPVARAESLTGELERLESKETIQRRTQSRDALKLSARQRKRLRMITSIAPAHRMKGEHAELEQIIAAAPAKERAAIRRAAKNAASSRRPSAKPKKTPRARRVKRRQRVSRRAPGALNSRKTTRPRGGRAGHGKTRRISRTKKLQKGRRQS